MNSECVDLIYLDPPFNSNQNYVAPVVRAADIETAEVFAGIPNPRQEGRETTVAPPYTEGSSQLQEVVNPEI
jgi:16S rRNA G966 N2-methylase RsmD